MWFYRKKKYGLSKEQYQTMAEKQNYECAICFSDGPLKVDHSHKTGKIRGLLCYLCNVGLGSFRDSDVFLENAKEYLRIC